MSRTAPDPGHPAEGTAAGVKAALELYARLTPDTFLTASASASTVHASYHARGTYGRKHRSRFAYGIETAVHGDLRYVEPRIGRFAQLTYGRTTVALSGGYLSNSDKGDGAYTSLSIYAPLLNLLALGARRRERFRRVDIVERRVVVHRHLDDCVAMLHDQVPSAGIAVEAREFVEEAT